MKLWLPLIFCIITVSAFAQQKEVTGIVVDKESNARIAKVNIINTGTGQSVYNNFKGEFKINAGPGDVLILSKSDHHNDTLTIKNYLPLVAYMKPVAIQLREVNIRDTLISPSKRRMALHSEFNKIYGSIGNRDLLSMAPSGVGFSIDALYNMFSRSGKNAEHLKEIMERDYKQSVIDFRFNKSYVANITRLEDPQLTDFMFKYRPGYYQVSTASEYDFVKYIRNSLRRYNKNPRAFDLPALPTVSMSVQ